jgi:hypothetical protein
MARHIGSRIGDHLPVFHRQKIGCFQWGLVQGRTQTHLPWPAIKDMSETLRASPDEWFHDVIGADGEAYDRNELDLVGKLANSTSLPSKAAGRNRIDD